MRIPHQMNKFRTRKVKALSSWAGSSWLPAASGATFLASPMAVESISLKYQTHWAMKTRMQIWKLDRWKYIFTGNWKLTGIYNKRI
jgi:hypothetical protein